MSERDPTDICTRLIVLARTVEIANSDVDRATVAWCCYDAVDEIRRLRRQVEALEAQLAELRRERNAC
jgi:ubiquinone biosynthesis protein UbiJ